jgi:hypothetical protein
MAVLVVAHQMAALVVVGPARVVDHQRGVLLAASARRVAQAVGRQIVVLVAQVVAHQTPVPVVGRQIVVLVAQVVAHQILVPVVAHQMLVRAVGRQIVVLVAQEVGHQTLVRAVGRQMAVLVVVEPARAVGRLVPELVG